MDIIVYIYIKCKLLHKLITCVVKPNIMYFRPCKRQLSTMPGSNFTRAKLMKKYVFEVLKEVYS